MRVLVTGGAGSVGVHVVRALIARGDAVTIVDDFNDFYDPAFKRARLAAVLRGVGQPALVEADIVDQGALAAAFADARPEAVVHLAAWPSVRPSVAHPLLYTRANVDGTVNVFEQSARLKVQNVVFSSSSSVYARGTPAPFREDAPCLSPIAPYGASKRASELFASVYHYLYDLPIVCLRFFTVYGPWVRPDMATWRFTEHMHRGEVITLRKRSTDGQEVQRDFTYVDDVVRAVVSALDRPLGFDIINVGNDHPVPLERFVRALESGLGKTANVREEPLPPEEAVVTAADPTHAWRTLGYAPTTAIEDGTRKFTEWYVQEYLPQFPQGLAASKYWTF